MMIEHAVAELIKSPRLSDHIKQLQDYWTEEQDRRKAFHANLPEGKKVEFINGEVVEGMPVKRDHADVVELLFALLQTFVHLKSLGKVGVEKLLVKLTRNDYEPDICFWGNAKADAFRPKQMDFPAPDFVVEVLSPSTEKVDRGVKFRDYASSGVGEYWLIDPDAQTIEQYLLGSQLYQLNVKVRTGFIKSAVVEGFEIPVRAIFDVRENLQALRKIMDS